jgi:hypothetical protein
MALKDESGNPLDDARLRDVVMSFVIAGRDTTANCLSWVFYELHRNPDVLQRYGARACVCARCGLAGHFAFLARVWVQPSQGD